jgi:hypothetical protein
MSSPNIILANTIYGKTTLYAATATLANVLVNSVGSNQTIKLNSVTYANASSNNIPIWVTLYRGTPLVGYDLASSVTVPSYSSLVVVAKDTSIYLEEGDVLRCNCGTYGVGSTSVVVSYELIA